MGLYSRLKKFLRKIFTPIPKKKKVLKEYSIEPRIKEPQPPIPDQCQFTGCRERLSIFNMKQCKYCYGYFCIDHTAPSEKHNCTGGPNVIPKKSYRSSTRR